MSRGGYAHPPCKMGHLVTTKRALVGSAVLGWGFALGMGGCVPLSPVLGEEGSGSGDGSVELIGSATHFVKSVNFPSRYEMPTACLPRPLPLSSDGVVSCSVFSARYAAGEGECLCKGAARGYVHPLARESLEDELAMYSQCGPGTSVDCEDFCICEELPAVDTSLDDCLNNQDPPDSSVGWCYVDPDHGRGSASLVSKCPAEQRRFLRHLANEVPTDSGEINYFVACTGGPVILGPTEPGPGAVGSPCFPGSERTHNFNGFALDEVGFEFGSPDCASNTCLINHMQGRASCPYGQTAEEAANAPECFRPGPDGQVTVPVDPQLVERRADQNAICSCRCDGPDASASYCTCPEGMVCSRLVEEYGIVGAGEGAYVGGHCIYPDTVYDFAHPPSAELCDRTLMNCGDPHPF
jgi:hypothetical protein